MKARIYVTLKPSVLDPQGQAVAKTLGRMGYPEVAAVRMGKYIEMEVNGDVTRKRIETMCEKLLANTVIEEYRVECRPRRRRAGSRPGSAGSRRVGHV